MKAHGGNCDARIDRSWADRLASGDRRSIATALTAVENDTPLARDILRDIHQLTGSAFVVGITGPPGVGKSTLLSLLMRFYDPTAGEVRLDGVALSNYKLKVKYLLILAYISIIIFIFNGYKYYNIKINKWLKE